MLKQLEKWMRITSALDALEDASWAVEYYCEQSYPEDSKGKYLYTYGLLQALYVQQDAAESINAVIIDTQHINWKTLFPEAYNIREMRNDVVGHPTNRNNRKEFVRLAGHFGDLIKAGGIGDGAGDGNGS